jgi:hypothetical protein
MSVTLPGLGVATPIQDLLGNYRVLLHNLPTVIDRYPTGRVVRNQAGNLSIVVEGDDGTIEAVGFIDVRTGDIELHDEPWPLITEETR